MTPQSLATASSLLHGRDWQRPLARSLKINDRLVRRWYAGDRPIPSWVRGRLIEALEERIKNIEAGIEELKLQEKE